MDEEDDGTVAGRDHVRFLVAVYCSNHLHTSDILSRICVFAHARGNISLLKTLQTCDLNCHRIASRTAAAVRALRIQPVVATRHVAAVRVLMEPHVMMPSDMARLRGHNRYLRRDAGGEGSTTRGSYGVVYIAIARLTTSPVAVKRQRFP